MNGKPRSKWIGVLAIGIALVIVVSTIGVWYWSVSGGSEGHPVVADGPTFYQAFAAANASVSLLPDGPWVPYQVEGIASPTPFSPNVMWVYSNYSMNYCGSAFDGLTLWNGSIPLFTGTANSGTAPFWQFSFFSNTSQQVTIATDVLGVARAFQPIGVDNPCAHWGGLDSYQEGLRDLSPVPADSPVMAASAWNATGQAWMERNQPSAVIYAMGGHPWNGWPAYGLLVAYYRCGMVGVTGTQPELFTLMNRSGTWDSYDNGTITCTAEEGLGGPPIPYELNFSSATLVAQHNTTVVELPFQSELIISPTTRLTDAFGLVAWMGSLSMTDHNGSLLPAGVPACQAWVPMVADCQANPTGWYAVLVSASGAWLTSFGAMGGGTNWTIPNVSIVSNQVLVIVVPSVWDLTGDAVSVATTTPAVVLSGMLSFG